LKIDAHRKKTYYIVIRIKKVLPQSNNHLN
jgi:hypothetical protein